MSQVDDHVIQKIADMMANEFGENVYLGDYKLAARDRINPIRAQEQFDVMQRYIPESLAGMKMIEIGSSYSSVQAFVKAHGMQPYGIEPSFESIEIGFSVWDSIRRGENIVVSVGEHLPFASNTFDIAFSSNVLEHVQNDDLVIKEAVRVLKLGGYLHFIFPNYGSVWDGHYSTFWIPFAPYWLARLSMRLRGRSPHYIDTLQLINSFSIRRYLRDNPELELISLGGDLFADRLSSLELHEWSGMRRLGTIVRLIRRAGLATLAARIALLLKMQTPFVMTARKK